MATKAFSTAIYKNGEISETLQLCNISKESYEEKYRGHLFCPNEKCGARLKFVLRKNGALPMLQSIDIHEHIKGCPYYFEYQKYDTDEKVRKVFSIEHISDSLKRQMQNFGVESSKKYKTKPKKLSRSPVNRHNEPTIQYFNAENVDETLESRAISVGGYIKSVKIVDTDPDQIHAYINFDVLGKKVSVFISHNRYLQDECTSEIVNQIRDAWQKTPQNRQSVCICFGWIMSVEKGINIVPVNLDSIRTGYK